MLRKLNIAAMVSVFIIALMVCIAEATLVPSLNLDSLIQNSTLIVTGQITSPKDEGQTYIFNGDSQIQVRAYSGTVKVNQVLKGEVPDGSVNVRYYVPTVDIGWSGVSSEYAVLFFKSDMLGNLEFSSPYYPYLTTTPGPVTEAGSPTRKVVSALKNRLVLPSASANEKRMTIFFLTRTRSSAATEALQATVADPNRDVSLQAVAGLLERNDISALGIAKEALLQDPPAFSSHLVQALSYSISQGVTDPNAIPILNELVASNTPEVRRAVASALMHIQSPDSNSIQARLLSDSDFETRYYAAVGLAEMNGQKEWRPSMEQFKADESKYLNHWRDPDKNR